jgi:hypothetical protein
MVARVPVGRRGSTSPVRSKVRRPSTSRAPLTSGGGRGWSGLLQENASAFTFLGITLGVFVSRKFFVVPVAIAAMMAQDLLKSGLDSAARRP